MSCRNTPIKQQVAVKNWIVRGDAVGDFHQVDDVLQQSAGIGVVVLYSRRRAGHALHEFVVGEEAFGQIAQVEVLHRSQQFGQSQGQPIDVGGGEGHEVGEIDFFRAGFADAGGDQLQAALVDLRGAFDVHQVAIFEGAMVGVGGVPHAGGDGAGAIGKFHLQIQIAVAVGRNCFCEARKI